MGPKERPSAFGKLDLGPLAAPAAAKSFSFVLPMPASHPRQQRSASGSTRPSLSALALAVSLCKFWVGGSRCSHVRQDCGLHSLSLVADMLPEAHMLNRIDGTNDRKNVLKKGMKNDRERKTYRTKERNNQ